MLKHIILPVSVAVLAIIFVDPIMVLMPPMLVYCALALLFTLFCVYALLVSRESTADEREVAHRAEAGRVSHLVGSGILVLGIIYQAHIIHSVDIFLIVALVAMTFAKFLTRMWAERNY